MAFFRFLSSTSCTTPLPPSSIYVPLSFTSIHYSSGSAIAYPLCSTYGPTHCSGPQLLMVCYSNCLLCLSHTHDHPFCTACSSSATCTIEVAYIPIQTASYSRGLESSTQYHLFEMCTATCLLGLSLPSVKPSNTHWKELEEPYIKGAGISQ
jgi:hypothetical protein